MLQGLGNSLIKSWLIQSRCSRFINSTIVTSLLIIRSFGDQVLWSPHLWITVPITAEVWNTLTHTEASVNKVVSSLSKGSFSAGNPFPSTIQELTTLIYIPGTFTWKNLYWHHSSPPLLKNKQFPLCHNSYQHNQHMNIKLLTIEFCISILMITTDVNVWYIISLNEFSHLWQCLQDCINGSVVINESRPASLNTNTHFTKINDDNSSLVQ